MTTTLTTQTPREIDEALGNLYQEIGKAESRRQSLLSTVREITGQRKVRGRWTGSLEDASKTYQDALDRGDRSLNQYSLYAGVNYLAQAQEVQVQIDALHAQTEPFHAEFTRRGGWSRFFLVTSSKGHIHSSQDCSTCLPTTQYGWLPSVSGKTEKDAVEEHGPLLCSVCFPTAPVEWTPEGYVDPSVCTGSGQYYASDKPKRTGYYTGNWGTCPVCDTAQTISKGGKIRKHKVA